MAEIDPDRLATLERSYALLNQMNEDPKSRVHLERAIKTRLPEVTTQEEVGEQLVKPHMDQFRDSVVAPLAEELKALREEREANRTAKVENDLDTAFTSMRRDRGFTDEGIEAVKRMMIDRSIADPMAAAALFAEQNPQRREEAPGWTPNAWNMEETVSDYDLKGLFANEDAWADKMAGTALNEIRMGNAA